MADAALARAPARRTFSGVAAVEAAVLVAAVAAAVALRLLVGGHPAGASVPAALVFAVVLAVVATAAGWRPAMPSRRSLAVGLAAGAGLCVSPLAHQLSSGSVGSPVGADGYLGWAVVVTGVAVAEEVVLRGVLYDACRRLAGDLAAVAVGAVVFAAMHVALYGTGAIALDTCVGLLLGCLRWTTGSVAAPAAAHSVADLAAWWLR